MSSTTLKIVVGFDFTDLAQNALETAAAFSGRFAGTELHVLTALEPTLMTRRVINKIDYDNAVAVQERLSKHLKKLPERAEMLEGTVFAHARIGEPAEEILVLAGELRADLIAVATHGHSGIPRLILGSVAETVTRGAHCPVLCVRPKDYDQLPKTLVPTPEPAGGPTVRRHLEPHVYRYEQKIAPMRPAAWPLY